MSQLFSFSRFARLFARHTAEFLPAYGMGTAVLTGGVVAVLGGLTYLSRRPLDSELQAVLFMAGLLTSGLLFTTTIFADLGDGRRAAPALLLPASHLEKYLVAWLYSMPVFLAVYVAIFLAVDALMLQWAGRMYPRWPAQLLDTASSWRPAITVLASYALVHGLALWGAIYFQRLHAVKTAFAVFGMTALLLVVNSRMWKLLATEIRPSLPFGDVFVTEKTQLFRIELPHQLALLATLPLLLAALLWLGAYARLTEKQL